jgi:hypothetical protein
MHAEMGGTLPLCESEGIMLSIICLLVFFGSIAALMGAAFNDPADPHDRYRRGPRGTIDHAADKALQSD